MSILDLLKGGDLRSIGRANEVVAQVLKDPAQFRAVFDGLANADPVVRSRAADVVEKVTAQRPDLLQPFVGRLLNEVGKHPQQEVQWHVAQVLPRLKLTDDQRKQAESLLMTYLGGRSSILRTSAMQALAELAARDPDLRARVAPLLTELTKTGTAAVRARGRKLLGRLGGGQGGGRRE